MEDIKNYKYVKKKIIKPNPKLVLDLSIILINFLSHLAFIRKEIKSCNFQILITMIINATLFSLSEYSMQQAWSS